MNEVTRFLHAPKNNPKFLVFLSVHFSVGNRRNHNRIQSHGERWAGNNFLCCRSLSLGGAAHGMHGKVYAVGGTKNHVFVIYSGKIYVYSSSWVLSTSVSSSRYIMDIPCRPGKGLCQLKEEILVSDSRRL